MVYLALQLFPAVFFVRTNTEAGPRRPGPIEISSIRLLHIRASQNGVLLPSARASPCSRFTEGIRSIVFLVCGPLMFLRLCALLFFQPFIFLFSLPIQGSSEASI
jgi:hypothetical protein